MKSQENETNLLQAKAKHSNILKEKMLKFIRETSNHSIHTFRIISSTRTLHCIVPSPRYNYIDIRRNLCSVRNRSLDSSSDRTLDSISNPPISAMKSWIRCVRLRSLHCRPNFYLWISIVLPVFFPFVC